jgi:hypothetical protein
MNATPPWAIKAAKPTTPIGAGRLDRGQSVPEHGAGESARDDSCRHTKDVDSAMNRCRADWRNAAAVNIFNRPTSAYI